MCGTCVSILVRIMQPGVNGGRARPFTAVNEIGTRATRLRRIPRLVPSPCPGDMCGRMAPAPLDRKCRCAPVCAASMPVEGITQADHGSRHGVIDYCDRPVRCWTDDRGELDRWRYPPVPQPRPLRRVCSTSGVAATLGSSALSSRCERSSSRADWLTNSNVPTSSESASPTLGLSRSCIAHSGGGRPEPVLTRV